MREVANPAREVIGDFFEVCDPFREVADSFVGMERPHA